MISSSNLVLARGIYSGSCYGARVQYHEPVPLASIKKFSSSSLDALWQLHSIHIISNQYTILLMMSPTSIIGTSNPLWGQTVKTTTSNDTQMAVCLHRELDPSKMHLKVISSKIVYSIIFLHHLSDLSNVF